MFSSLLGALYLAISISSMKNPIDGSTMVPRRARMPAPPGFEPVLPGLEPVPPRAAPHKSWFSVHVGQLPYTVDRMYI